MLAGYTSAPNSHMAFRPPTLRRSVGKHPTRELHNLERFSISPILRSTPLVAAQRTGECRA
jgi:hypothetical protein